MKKAHFQGSGTIAIVEADAPQAGEGEVAVRVTACALCGSEMKQWRNGWPVTPGHEIAGVIDNPGHRRHGERVIVYIRSFAAPARIARRGGRTCVATSV